MNTKNQNAVTLFIEETLNRGNLMVIGDLIHPNYRYDSPSESMQGIDQLKAFVQALRNAFPDLRVHIEEQFGTDEKICTRISMTGTHLGDFLGIPATGKPVKLQGVIISQIKDGLIHREWELLDQLTLLQQIGLAAS